VAAEPFFQGCHETLAAEGTAGVGVVAQVGEHGFVAGFREEGASVRRLPCWVTGCGAAGATTRAIPGMKKGWHNVRCGAKIKERGTPPVFPSFFKITSVVI
jgi:hypothetical protein